MDNLASLRSLQRTGFDISGELAPGPDSGVSKGGNSKDHREMGDGIDNHYRQTLTLVETEQPLAF
jgi:hypothetical protein